MDAAHTTRPLKKAALLLLVAYVVLLVAGTHAPRLPRFVVGGADKMLHLTAYFGLAVLVSLNVSLRRRIGWRGALSIAIALGLFGWIDERTQTPVGRHYDVIDWGADSVGAALGVVAFKSAQLLRWSVGTTSVVNER